MSKSSSKQKVQAKARVPKQSKALFIVIYFALTIMVFSVILGVNLGYHTSTDRQETFPGFVDDDGAWVVQKTEIGYHPILAEQIEYNEGFWSGYEVKTDTKLHVSTLGLYLVLSLILTSLNMILFFGVKSIF